MSPMKSQSVWAPWTLIAVVYSICLGVIASSLYRSFGFPLDDSYITQTIARNLAQTGVLGFTPGKLSPGATSLLWIYIQAANFKFLHLDPVIFNLTLSWLLLILIGILLFTIARRDGLSITWCLGIAISPAFCGSFLWLGMIGMEHLLFVALTLCAVFFWLEHDLRSAVFAGLAIGLIAITRPDAIPLGLALLLTAPFIKRKPREILVALSIWTFFVGVAIAANLLLTHSLLPGTMNGRAWLYFRNGHTPHSLASVSSFLLFWMVKALSNFSLCIVGPLTIKALLLSLIPLALAFAGIRWILNKRLGGLRILALLTVLHFCIFLALFPSGGQGGRYQPLNLLLLMPLLLLGSASIACAARSHSKLIAAFVAGILILAGTCSLHTWRTVTIDSIAHINNTHGKAAEWLVANSLDNRTAAFDFGRISYISKNPVIDLGGLTDPSFVPYMVAGRAPDYVKETHIRFLILPSGKIPGLLGFRSLPKEEIHFCTPSTVWTVSMRYTGNAEQCQTIYDLKQVN